MPFQFGWLCELLDELDKSRHKRLLTTARSHSYQQQIISNWYQRFSHRIQRTGPSASAFLSCILPERRPDRVYNLQAKRLSHIFGRALGLGASRAAELNHWRNRDGSDFPTCVERVLKQCENDTPAPGKEVTLEEVDEVLNLIAAHSISSAPAIRAKVTSSNPSELLTPILRRLKSSEAKWFTRMLLKSYAPVQIPEYEALHGFHFLLPKLLSIQNSFAAAITVLAKEAICQLPPQPDKAFERALLPLLAQHVQPQLGVMIKRQPYHKGRSVKNCYSLAQGKHMSVERKYDGEYCQIHINLSKGYDCIQIFSKSGKDSTNDRIKLHAAIRDGLRIGRNECHIRNRCIIEGELLVWNGSEGRIQPFHKIRKYVKHGGRQMGTAQDSPSKPDEGLMIAFYDILLLDNRLLLNEPHKLRRQHLKAVVHTIEGRSILCERTIIDFRSAQAASRLRKRFADSISQRWEGLILKASDEPYFHWDHQSHGIKFKKDYIYGLGDAADLCILGGRRDPHIELLIGAGCLRWTSFYVGTVCNMDAVRRFDAKPRIKVIDLLTHHSMPRADLLDLNRLGRLVEIDYKSEIAEYEVEMVPSGMKEPTELFKIPFVVEILGAGFEKLPDSSVFTLRFPRKVDGRVKLHMDRTLLDTVSFDELQLMAEKSLHISEEPDSQEDAQWIEKLIQADGKGHKITCNSQNTESLGTPFSAPAMSLSPSRQRIDQFSDVFVRPDTEEPETQETNGLISIASATGLSPNINGQPESQVPARTSRCQQTAHKSDFSVLKPINNDMPKRKRRCLQDVRHTDRRDELLNIKNNAHPTIPSSLRMTTTTGKCRKQNSSKDLDNKQGVDPFNPPTEFFVLHQKAVSAARIEETPSDDLITPDSTLLMRQILTLENNQGHRSHELAPTETLSGKVLQYASIVCDQSSAQRSHKSQSVLPTPPASSPPNGSRNTDFLVQPKRRNHQNFDGQSGVHPTATLQPDRFTRETNSVDHVNTSHAPSPMTTIISFPHKAKEQHYTPPPFSSTLVLNVHHSLVSTLSMIKASFTFAVDHFIDQIAACSSLEKGMCPRHVILTDATQPNAAADAFEHMAHRLQSRLQATTPNFHHNTAAVLDAYNANHAILVFDHRILQRSSVTRSTRPLSLDRLRALDFANGHGQDAALFCGVLQLYPIVGEVNTPQEVEGNTRDKLRVGIRLDYTFEWLEEGREVLE